MENISIKKTSRKKYKVSRTGRKVTDHLARGGGRGRRGSCGEAMEGGGACRYPE